MGFAVTDARHGEFPVRVDPYVPPFPLPQVAVAGVLRGPFCPSARMPRRPTHSTALATRHEPFAIGLPDARRSISVQTFPPSPRRIRAVTMLKTIAGAIGTDALLRS